MNSCLYETAFFPGNYILLIKMNSCYPNSSVPGDHQHQHRSLIFSMCSVVHHAYLNVAQTIWVYSTLTHPTAALFSNSIRVRWHHDSAELFTFWWIFAAIFGTFFCHLFFHIFHIFQILNGFNIRHESATKREDTAVYVTSCNTFIPVSVTPSFRYAACQCLALPRSLGPKFCMHHGSCGESSSVKDMGWIICFYKCPNP